MRGNVLAYHQRLDKSVTHKATTLGTIQFQSIQRHGNRLMALRNSREERMCRMSINQLWTLNKSASQLGRKPVAIENAFVWCV